MATKRHKKSRATTQTCVAPIGAREISAAASSPFRAFLWPKVWRFWFGCLSTAHAFACPSNSSRPETMWTDSRTSFVSLRRIAILDPDAGYKQNRPTPRGIQSNFRVTTMSSRLNRTESRKAFLAPFFERFCLSPEN